MNQPMTDRMDQARERVRLAALSMNTAARQLAEATTRAADATVKLNAALRARLSEKPA
jgi:hypothetical protein